MSKVRGFELVSQFSNKELLPKRETAHAAGYDLKVAKKAVIEPGEITLVPTGIKAYMQPGRSCTFMIVHRIHVKKGSS